MAAAHFEQAERQLAAFFIAPGQPAQGFVPRRKSIASDIGSGPSGSLSTFLDAASAAGRGAR